MNSDLTLDLTDPKARPYFLWSEDLNLEQLREILAGGRGDFLRWVYAGRILREAKMRDVWCFFKPQWIADNWPNLDKHLGRKRGFWADCLRIWRDHGLIR